MGLKGRLTAEKVIHCHGDIFHDLIKHKPHHLSNISPDHVHSCNVHKGQYGTVGSVLAWEYSHDGKKEEVKVVIDAIDEKKKLVKFKAVEGDIMQQFKEYCASVHVDTKGDDHVVTWTIEYEKVKEDVPDPLSYLDVAVKVTRDIEARHAAT